MTHIKLITIGGGFHNSSTITIRAKIDTRPCGGIILSAGQVKKIRNHMCGNPDCICGMHHGWEIGGSDKAELSEAFTEVDSAEFSRR